MLRFLIGIQTPFPYALQPRHLNFERPTVVRLTDIGTTEASLTFLHRTSQVHIMLQNCD
jgi:hypothetical protein